MCLWITPIMGTPQGRQESQGRWRGLYSCAKRKAAERIAEGNAWVFVAPRKRVRNSDGPARQSSEQPVAATPLGGCPLAREAA